jgi:hypothetical protein
MPSRSWLTSPVRWLRSVPSGSTRPHTPIRFSLISHSSPVPHRWSS